MGLASGTRLGPYEIVGALGAGGMGEVYRAKDTRLGRIVALKVISASLSADASLRQRFEREAKALSSISHPNICALYDVGEHEGSYFIVMEFIEGEDLEHRLRKGPMPVDKALQIGAEICGALDRAHRMDVIHRDLKPANIMLTKTGARLLDFGLAKPVKSAFARAASASETIGLGSDTAATPTLTGEGTIVGTLQYMAPEQVQGKPADARSDLFSLGAVLYETLTGRRAFDAADPATVIANILTVDPPKPSVLDSRISPAVERVIERCLAKDPEERWQTARDLGMELQWVRGQSSGAMAATAISATMQTPAAARWAKVLAWARKATVWGALACLVFLLAALGFIIYARTANNPVFMGFEVVGVAGIEIWALACLALLGAWDLCCILTRLRFPGDSMWRPRRLPLGLIFALAVILCGFFAGVTVRQRAHPPRLSNITQLTANSVKKAGPLVSDGVRLYFNQLGGLGAQIFQVSVSGGDMIPVGQQEFDNYHRLADISPDHTRLLVLRLDHTKPGRLFLSPWSYQLPQGPAQKLGNIVADAAAFSPDGAQVAFSDRSGVHVSDLSGRNPRQVARTLRNSIDMIHWSPDGRRLAVSDPEDSSTTQFATDTGNEKWRYYPVSYGIIILNQFLHSKLCCGVWTADGNWFIFSADGDLWAQPEHWSFPVAPAFAFPNAVRLTFGPTRFHSPLPGADGKKLFAIGEHRRGELVRYDPASKDFLLYLGGISATDVTYSPDGKKIAYVSYPDELLWVSNADGTDRRQLTFAPLRVRHPAWSPDQNTLAFMGKESPNLWTIYLIPPRGGTPSAALTAPSALFDGYSKPSWGPDSQRLAFSDLATPESGSHGVIHLLDLRTHTLTTLPGSEGYQEDATWSPDGRYIAAGLYGKPEMRLFDTTTQKSEDLPFMPFDPTWSRDSKYIYGLSATSGTVQLVRISMANKKQEKVTDITLPHLPTHAHQYEMWMGLTPDGSPMVLRDIGTSDIYSFDLDLP